ncbi:MAG: QueT transporter family protein [Clostridiales bacterium]|nr:QueT transporter family protein [Clostridiales bacterium]
MKTKHILQAAVIAAAYAAVTILLAPLSYGVMQIRVSEALSILPYFTPAAVPGLFVGCFIANLASPNGIADLVCGSLSSLFAAWFSYKLRDWPALVPMPPVAVNGIAIGAMIYFVYGIPMPLLACMAWVAAGQACACYILGYPLLCYLKKFEGIFK